MRRLIDPTAPLPKPVGTKLALGFLAFAVPWIFVSDHVAALYTDRIDTQFAQTVKGLVFVGLSALLVKAIGDRAMRRLHAAHGREQRAKQQLERAQEVAGLGSWEIDLASGRLSWSEQALALLGPATTTPPSSPAALLECVHRDDRPAFDAAWRRTVDAGEPLAIEHRLAHAGEPASWVVQHADVVTDETGARRVVTGTVRDITAQKTAEHRTALLRMAGELARFGGWRMEAGADHVFWSDETARIHDEPPGTHPRAERARRYAHPDDRDRVAGLFERCLAEGQAFDTVFRLITASGRERHVRVTGEPERGGQGRIVAARGAFQDITEMRELDARLHRAQKLETVGQLTGGVAHDFNNLLTIILGNAEMLEDLARDPEEVRTAARIILEAAERGAGLTQNLLAFSRRQPLAPEPTDLHALIRASAPLFRQGVHEGLELDVELAADHPIASIDPNKLQTALLNLVVNSRQALGGRGRIWIETGNAGLDADYASRHAEVTPGDYVVIAVSDDGPGMAPEVVERAFDPFFTTKQAGGGTGLGLSSVYGFVKQSGGHAKIYSEVGHGTSVKLYLPRADAPATATAAPAVPKVFAGGGEHVLVVEDDPTLRAHAVGQVTRMGYRVSAAANGAEALDRLREAGDVDLLFTDVVMPGGMNGRELADAARQRFPALQVLFTSGYTHNVIVHQGRLDEGIELLSKPYRYDDLARHLHRLLTEDVGSSPERA